MDLQKTKLIVSKTVVSKSTLKELQDTTSLENLFSLWQDMPSPVIHAYSSQPLRKVEGKIQRPNEEKLDKKRKMDETFKIQNVDPLKVEGFDGNPWLVDDVSVFLNYCCPECDYKEKDLRVFSDHALENHEKATAFFGTGDSSDELHSDIKIEENERHHFLSDSYQKNEREIVIKDENNLYSDTSETFESENQPEKEKLGKRKLGIRKKGVKYGKKWKHSICSEKGHFNCSSCKERKRVFETKIEATQHFLTVHFEQDQDCDKTKLEVCQYCIEVFADLYELEGHHKNVHPKMDRKGYSCQLCTSPGLPRTSMKTVLEHYNKMHSKDRFPYQCHFCDDTFIFFEEVYIHEFQNHADNLDVKPTMNKCEICPFSCYSKQNFMVHKHTHDSNSDPPILCNFCEFTSTSASEMIQHHTEKHFDKDPTFSKCSLCDFYTKSYNRKMLKDHCKKEHGVVNSLQFVSYRCHVCSKEMMTKKSVEIHALGECSASSFLINCELCKMTFPSKEAFKVHKAGTHFDVRDPDKWCCPHCDHKVKEFPNMKIHIDSKHPEHDEKKHFCDKCGNGFIFLVSLTEHTRKKHSNFVCELCGASYKTKEAYKEHKIMKHDSIVTQDFVCEACGYASHSKKKLRAHQKIVHEKEKHHKCPCCTYKNPLLFRLNIHIDRVHPDYGEKKIFCNHCPKSFIYKASLKKHLEMLPEHRNLKPYSWNPKLNMKCDYCETILNSTQEAKMHYKTEHFNQPMILEGHTRYTCSLCNAFYFTEFGLKKHNRRAHDETIYDKDCLPDPVPCDYCSEVFTSSYRIKAHYKNIHPTLPIVIKGHKKYNCDNCSEFFIIEKELQAHLNLEHGLQTKMNYCKICRVEYKDLHNCGLQKQRENIKKCQYKYPCSLCPREFFAQDNLRHHVKSVHENCLDYECKQCKKKFVSKTRLTSHIFQTHSSQVNCEICDKKISNPLQLKRHKVFSHNETEGAIFCAHCPKSVFFLESTYNIHMRNKHDYFENSGASV